MSEKDNTNISLLIQKLDSKIDKVSADFHSELYKIKTELDKIQTTLFFKLSSVIIGAVSVAFLLVTWLFDYKFDFTNEQHQAHFEKLDTAVFISRYDAMFKAIQDLKDQISNENIKKYKKKQTRKQTKK